MVVCLIDGSHFSVKYSMTTTFWFLENVIHQNEKNDFPHISMQVISELLFYFLLHIFYWRLWNKFLALCYLFQVTPLHYWYLVVNFLTSALPGLGRLLLILWWIYVFLKLFSTHPENIFLKNSYHGKWLPSYKQTLNSV